MKKYCVQKDFKLCILKFYMFCSLTILWIQGVSPTTRGMNCEITAQTCQPPFQTITVTPKDSKVALKCSIKTGRNAQDMTWQSLERNLNASKGLYLLQNYSTDVNQSRGCFSIKYAIPVQRVFKTSSPVDYYRDTRQMELKCTFKGWPRPRVAWYNPDSKLIINGSESFYLYEQLVGEDTLSSVLRNPNIQEKHAGTYKCTGMNNITGWSTRKYGKIDLVYYCLFPRAPQVSSPKVSVTAFTNVSLRCLVDVRPSDCWDNALKWYFNNSWASLKSDEKYDIQERRTNTRCKIEFIITIFNVTEADEGKYKCTWSCEIDYPSFSRSSIIQLKVFSSPTDIVPQRILHCEIVASCSQSRNCQSSNRTAIVRPKDKVTLNCSIKTGGKVQNMTWQDLEKTLSARNGLFVQQNDSSDGRQSCECYSMKYASGIELVNITNSSVWFSSNTTLTELKCSFKGWPRPRILWYSPARKLIINGSESFYLTEKLVGEDTITSVLSNPNIQEKHKGIYECLAITTIDVGEPLEKSQKIKLLYNCSWSSGHVHTSISSSDKFPVPTSSNVILKCVVEVEPYTDCAKSGELKWLLNDDWSLEHGNTKKYEMPEKGNNTICKKEFIVTIFKVTEKDEGKYSCRWLCSGVKMATSSPIQLKVFSSPTGHPNDNSSKRRQDCEISAFCSPSQKCQFKSQTKTKTVTPKDSNITLNCSITLKTGEKVQDMTWQELEEHFDASLILQQIYSKDGKTSCECFLIKYASGIKMVENTSSPVWFSPNKKKIELKCSFKGWPRPRVVWYSPDGKLITDGSESFYLSEKHRGDDTVTSVLSVLRNSNVQEKHNGVYKCKAMNNITGWSSELSEDIELIYNSTTKPPSRNSTSINKIIYISLGVTTTILLLAIAIFTSCYRRKKTTERLPYSQREIIPLDKWEILPEQIEYEEELGRGAFGVVYKATFRKRVVLEVFDTDVSKRPLLSTKKAPQVVAVKVLYDDRSKTQKEEFTFEIEQMKLLGSHKNVVSMVGCCTIQEKMFLVIEYVPCGDLLTWLRRRRKKIFEIQASERSYADKEALRDHGETRDQVSKVAKEQIKQAEKTQLQVSVEKTPLLQDNSEDTASTSYYLGNEESKQSHEIGELTPLSEESNDDVRQELASTFQGHLEREESKLSKKAQVTMEMASLSQADVTQDMASTNQNLSEDEQFKVTDKELLPSTSLSPGQSQASAKSLSNDNLQESDDEDEEEGFSTKQLFSFAWQIAKGMNHLAENNLVHRDLAARNVLVGHGNQVKVSDFGLMRQIYEDVYSSRKSKKLPVKWMAPESLYQGVYTTKSDVWSFGVVLWEMATLGGVPYPTLTNSEVYRLLGTGYRMERPDMCSDDVYELISDCWKEDPNIRPSFYCLIEKLEAIMERDAPYLNVNKHNEDRSYYNVPPEASAD